HVAVALVQPVHALEKLEPALPLERGPLGRRGRVSRRLGRGRTEHELRTPAGGTPTVVGLVRNDPQEPRLERRARTEPRKGGPRLDEAGLGGVLRICRRSRQQKGCPEGDVLIHPHELLEGARVTAPGALRERGVLRRSALHRPVLHRSWPRRSISPCDLYTAAPASVPGRDYAPRGRCLGIVIVSGFGGAPLPRCQLHCHQMKNAAERTMASAATYTLRRTPAISCEGSMRSVSIHTRPRLYRST